MDRAGIYIHIPFCRSRCSYCDFATGAYDGPLAKRYVQVVAGEISGFGEAENLRTFQAAPEVDTIFFGGGTPSLLTPAQVACLLDAVRQRFRVTADAEVTMEMNPGTVSLSVLQEFRRLGINRASFGAQTFDDRELRRLGRTHTTEDARRTLSDLRTAGFDNVSFDLIAGLPGQTIDSWLKNLSEALVLRPPHLSLYLLEVHEGTPLAEQLKRGMWPPPDDDTAGEMYRSMLEQTDIAGYEHYEISNFCLPGYESRHNTKYWTGAPFYGFGCSAHSYDGASLRWSNERDTARYVQLLEAKQHPVVERIELDEQAARAEALFLGLRLMRGVDLNNYHARFNVDVRDQHADALARFSEAGLIELHDGMMKLTRSGALLSNEVFAALL